MRVLLFRGEQCLNLVTFHSHFFYVMRYVIRFSIIIFNIPEERRKHDDTRINDLTLAFVSRNLAVFKLPKPVACVVPLILVRELLKQYVPVKSLP
jgi:hypothetical protein